MHHALLLQGKIIQVLARGYKLRLKWIIWHRMFQTLHTDTGTCIFLHFCSEIHYYSTFSVCYIIILFLGSKMAHFNKKKRRAKSRDGSRREEKRRLCVLNFFMDQLRWLSHMVEPLLSPDEHINISDGKLDNIYERTSLSKIDVFFSLPFFPTRQRRNEPTKESECSFQRKSMFSFLYHVSDVESAATANSAGKLRKNRTSN